jgi:hypothetical protein
MAAAAATLPTGDAAAAGAGQAQLHKSLFRAALDKAPSVKDAEGNILTEPFLDLCQLVLPLIGERAQRSALPAVAG